MISPKDIFITAVSAFCFSFLSLSAATNLDQMMTDQEKQQTGVFNLTPQQKQALGTWIDKNYTAINPQTPPSTQTKDLYLSVNVRNGQQLILSDGSLWQVNPSDIAISSLWITPFPMQITASNDPQYPWILMNLNTKEQVKAKKLKPGNTP